MVQSSTAGAAAGTALPSPNRRLLALFCLPLGLACSTADAPANDAPEAVSQAPTLADPGVGVAADTPAAGTGELGGVGQSPAAVVPNPGDPGAQLGTGTPAAAPAVQPTASQNPAAAQAVTASDPQSPANPQPPANVDSSPASNPATVQEPPAAVPVVPPPAVDVPPNMPAPPPAVTNRPNIIVIYTDDQGYGDVSALNPDSKFETPNMDRLANEGVTFTDGHSSDAICTPSRYSLLTGRYSFRTRLKSGVLTADGDCLIENGRMTVASLLQQNGYKTAMIGKWHLDQQFPGTKGNRNWDLPITDGPPEKGFDYYFGLAGSMNYGLLTYIENTSVLEIPSMWTRKKVSGNIYKNGPAFYRITTPYDAQQQRPADYEVAPSFSDEKVLPEFTKRTVNYITENAAAAKAGQPFFIYLPVTSPHLPHSVSAPFEGKSNAGVYGDFMIETDDLVGQVLDALESNGIADDTLVFLTSDNGAETNYIDQIANFAHHSNVNLRDGKRSIYEGGHRVPFLMRWPRVISAGGVVNHPVSQVDLLATVADIIDAELPDDHAEDSYSLLPAMIEGDQTQQKRGPMLIHAGDDYAIRDGALKLVVRGNSVELYDLDSDISEKRNIAGNRPEQVKRMTEMLSQMVVWGRGRPGTPQQNDGNQCWDQLTWMPRCNSAFWNNPVDPEFWNDLAE